MKKGELSLRIEALEAAATNCRIPASNLDEEAGKALLEKIIAEIGGRPEDFGMEASERVNFWREKVADAEKAIASGGQSAVEAMSNECSEFTKNILRELSFEIATESIGIYRQNLATAIDEFN